MSLSITAGSRGHVHHATSTSTWYSTSSIAFARTCGPLNGPVDSTCWDGVEGLPLGMQRSRRVHCGHTAAFTAELGLPKSRSKSVPGGAVLGHPSITPNMGRYAHAAYAQRALAGDGPAMLSASILQIRCLLAPARELSVLANGPMFVVRRARHA